MKKYFFITLFFIISIFTYGNNIVKNDDIIFDDFTYSKSDEKIQKDLTIVQALKVSSIDPIFIKDIYSRRVISLVYDTLFTMDNKKIVPLLVKDYKWKNEKELYIKLKKDIYFHDGTLLTANDVKNSLNRLKNESLLNIFYSDISDIKVLNNNELIIKTNSPDKNLIFNLSHEISSIVKKGKDKLVGTGPFYVDKFTNNSLDLKKFSNYFYNSDKLENIESVTFERGISPNQRMIALFNGDAQIALDINENELNTGKSYGIIDDTMVIEKSIDIDTLAIIFGNNLNLSYEDKKIIESIVNKKADYFLPKEILSPNLSKIDINYNPDIIKKNLENSSLKGKTLNLMTLNTYHDIKEAEKIKTAFEKYGIRVNIFLTQIDSFYYKVENKDFDIALYNFIINKNYPLISLAKITLYDLKDEKMYNTLKDFIKKSRTEKNSNKEFDKTAKFMYDLLPYIPIEHTTSYIIKKI